MKTSALVLAASLSVLALLSGCAPSAPSGPLTATVTFAGIDPALPGYVSATGSVSGVAETGGKCAFTFWAKTGVATRLRSTGHSDGTHTVCGPVSEPEGFMNGIDYEVELRYDTRSGERVMSGRVPMVLR